MKALGRRRLLLLCCALLFAADRGRAQTAAGAETQIKAAYIFKFLSFVDWPASTFASAEAPLTIGVLGATMLADELARIVVGRQANGRPVQVRRLQPGDATTDLQVLFLARAEGQRLPALAAALKDRPTLVVTEAGDTAPPGSSIHFVIVDDKVRFDVALATIEKAGLKVSARLLTVARRVLQTAS